MNAHTNVRSKSGDGKNAEFGSGTCPSCGQAGLPQIVIADFRFVAGALGANMPVDRVYRGVVLICRNCTTLLFVPEQGSSAA